MKQRCIYPTDRNAGELAADMIDKVWTRMRGSTGLCAQTVSSSSCAIGNLDKEWP